MFECTIACIVCRSPSWCQVRWQYTLTTQKKGTPQPVWWRLGTRIAVKAAAPEMDSLIQRNASWLPTCTTEQWKTRRIRTGRLDPTSSAPSSNRKSLNHVFMLFMKENIAFQLTKRQDFGTLIWIKNDTGGKQPNGQQSASCWTFNNGLCVWCWSVHKVIQPGPGVTWLEMFSTAEMGGKRVKESNGCWAINCCSWDGQSMTQTRDALINFF